MDFMYSPILNSSQPAFLANVAKYEINYTIPEQLDTNLIEYLCIKIVQQKDNINVVDTVDGIIYIPFNSGTLNRNQTVQIDRSMLKNNHWKKDTYYKLQMRFGTRKNKEETYNIKSNFSNWKNNMRFSEWSGVMLLKAIGAINITIINKSNSLLQGLTELGYVGYESGLTPLIQTVYQSESLEYENQYRFELWEQLTEDSPFVLIEDSNWLQHNVSNDFEINQNINYTADSNQHYEVVSSDNYRFNYNLNGNVENTPLYKVVYSIKTINDYEASTEYTFKIRESLIQETLNFSLQAIGDNENALNKIYITNLTEDSLTLFGNYVLTRSDETSQFNTWTDLTFVQYSGGLNSVFDKGESQCIYTDYTIENGIQYRYALQKQNAAMMRTAKIYSEKVEVNFEYMYLYNNNIQLKLKLNPKVTNFKVTKQAQKQDSLGGKYPIIFRNGTNEYKEFSINSLISIQADSAEHFFELKETKNSSGYYYKDELIIPANKLKKNYVRQGTTNNNVDDEGDLIEYSTETNLTHNTIFIEQKFREKVLEFLNDGNYKLFKSPTEGNMIITLINVTTTPEDRLGRMLYSISAQAYEMMENTIENLINYNILPFKSFQAAIENEELMVGQLEGMLWWDSNPNVYQEDSNNSEYTLKYNENLFNNINLIDLIKQQVFKNMEEGYQYQLVNLNSITLDAYPKINLTNLIDYYVSLVSQALIDSGGDEQNKKVVSLTNQLNYYKQLQYLLEIQPQYPLVELNINDAQVMLGYNKTYHLDTLNSSDTIYYAPVNYRPVPLVVNYTCKTELIETASSVIKGENIYGVWGQISGIFTKDTNLYNYYLQSIAEDEKNNALYLYNNSLPIKYYYYNQDISIQDILNNKVELEIEKALKQITSESTFDFSNLHPDETEGVRFKYDDKLRYGYHFDGFEGIEIEGDPGTILEVSNNGKQNLMVIGPTGKLVLEYTGEGENNVRVLDNLSISSDAHLTINYYALVTIREREGKR